MTNAPAMLDFVNQAAQQTDRWLFLATLALMFLGYLSAARWLVGDRKAVAERLEKITDKQIEQAASIAALVERNTLALVAIERTLTRCHENNPRHHV